MNTKPRFYFLLLLLIGAFILWCLNRDELFFRLWIFSFLLMLFSSLYTYFSVKYIEVNRSSRVLRHKVGDFFEEQFTVKNKASVWLLWLELVDHSRISSRNNTRVFSLLAPKIMRAYNTYTLLTQRGAFKLGPIELISGDPFGFFNSSKKIEGEETLVVLPYVVDIDKFAYLPGYLTGGSVLHKATTETTPYAAGVREFVPGDPLNRIHWPTTVRREKIMVKEFDRDPQTNAWLFLDVQKEIHYFDKKDEQIEFDVRDVWSSRVKFKFALPRSTIEYAISISASIVNFYLKQGYAAGLATAGKKFRVISPEKGERQLGKMLEMLAFIKCDGNIPLLGLVEGQVKNLPRGSTLVLVTPSQHSSVESAVDIAISRGLKPIVVLFDTASFGGMETSLKLQRNLSIRHVPTVLVEYGRDLKELLENTGVFNYSHQARAFRFN